MFISDLFQLNTSTFLRAISFYGILIMLAIFTIKIYKIYIETAYDTIKSLKYVGDQ